jgi:hypothetical protein
MRACSSPPYADPAASNAIIVRAGWVAVARAALSIKPTRRPLLWPARLTEGPLLERDARTSDEETDGRTGPACYVPRPAVDRLATAGRDREGLGS